jgi:deoxycytidylate deaminase/dephospho-CoA kinase
MDSRPKVIGLTGPFGSGCTTAAEYLKSKVGFEHIRLSDIIHQVWAERNPGVQETRSGLQAIGDEQRRKYGRDYLVRRSIENVAGAKFVVDGIRNVGEIEYLRDSFGYSFTLIGIIPTYKARWDRIGSKSYSEDKEGQTLFFADDLRDRDEESSDGQQVGKCVDQADILIDNSHTVNLGDYKQRVLDYVKLAIGETRRSPSREEIFMNMAYSACHSSQCLKRHVGALVIDSENNPVGVGYNENPLGTEPCKKEYNRCFKDMQREEHLKSLVQETGRLYCPVCGTQFCTEQGLKADCGECAKRGLRRTIPDILYPERGMTYCTAIHAEAWALSSAGVRARRGQLFTTTYPCLLCAEKIIHSGISAVWYTEPYPDAVSGDRLKNAGVKLQQFEGVRCFDRMFANSRPS